MSTLLLSLAAIYFLNRGPPPFTESDVRERRHEGASVKPPPGLSGISVLGRPLTGIRPLPWEENQALRV